MDTPSGDRSFPHHGGDLSFAVAHYRVPRAAWLDLSTGINPNPYPLVEFSPEQATRLPASADLQSLVAAARSAYAVPDAVDVSAVPGTEAAIGVLPLVAQPGPVTLVGPTYGSHRRAWESAGRVVRVVPGLADVPVDARLLVLCNPNNPDGRVTPPGGILETAERLGQSQGILVVDEAFADIEPDGSVVPRLTPASPVVVLRSFGKSFGLPGLRLGFVIGSAGVATRLAAAFGDWPVSGPAIATGTAALADRAWQEGTRLSLHAASNRLQALLARHKLGVAGATALFVLVDDPRVNLVHERLARTGIWTRAFPDRPSWLRFGLPGSDAAFERLDTALAEAFR